jgi:hypothetical protein
MFATHWSVPNTINHSTLISHYVHDVSINYCHIFRLFLMILRCFDASFLASLLYLLWLLNFTFVIFIFFKLWLSYFWKIWTSWKQTWFNFF